MRGERSGGELLPNRLWRELRIVALLEMEDGPERFARLALAPVTFAPAIPLAATVTARIWPNIELQWEDLGGLPPMRRAAVIGAQSSRSAADRALTAGDERALPLADQVFGALARRDDLARDLQPENIRRPRGRRIHAPPLQHVGAIDPGRGHLDQHFARTRPGQRPFDHRQPALTVRDYRAHRGGKLTHPRAY